MRLNSDAGIYLVFSLDTVRCMMYGFGDDQAPFTESVDLLEDLVVEYISEMVSRVYRFKDVTKGPRPCWKQTLCFDFELLYF